MRIFKKLKVQSVVVSLLYLVLGICLLAVPDAAKRTVCYFAGAMLIVSGLVQIINYFLYSVVRFGFLWGIIDVFAGIFYCQLGGYIRTDGNFRSAFRHSVGREKHFRVSDGCGHEEVRRKILVGGNGVRGAASCLGSGAAVRPLRSRKGVVCLSRRVFSA